MTHEYGITFNVCLSFPVRASNLTGRNDLADAKTFQLTETNVMFLEYGAENTELNISLSNTPGSLKFTVMTRGECCLLLARCPLSVLESYCDHSLNPVYLPPSQLRPCLFGSTRIETQPPAFCRFIQSSNIYATPRGRRGQLQVPISEASVRRTRLVCPPPKLVGPAPVPRDIPQKSTQNSLPNTITESERRANR